MVRHGRHGMAGCGSARRGVAGHGSARQARLGISGSGGARQGRARQAWNSGAVSTEAAPSHTHTRVGAVRDARRERPPTTTPGTHQGPALLPPPIVRGAARSTFRQQHKAPDHRTGALRMVRYLAALRVDPTTGHGRIRTDDIHLTGHPTDSAPKSRPLLRRDQPTQRPHGRPHQDRHRQPHRRPRTSRHGERHPAGRAPRARDQISEPLRRPRRPIHRHILIRPRPATSNPMPHPQHRREVVLHHEPRQPVRGQRHHEQQQPEIHARHRSRPPTICFLANSPPNEP